MVIIQEPPPDCPGRTGAVYRRKDTRGPISGGRGYNYRLPLPKPDVAYDVVVSAVTSPGCTATSSAAPSPSGKAVMVLIFTAVSAPVSDR
jgi:hypothetical protein